MKSIDKRIVALENSLPRSNIAGTRIERVMHEKSGLEWCLSLGPMEMPKNFFVGPTIEDVLTQAEIAFEIEK